MPVSIRAEHEVDLVVHSKELKVNRIQDFCPLCHRDIKPVYRYAWESDEELQVVFECPSKDCQKLFIAYYRAPKTDEKDKLEIEYYFTCSEPIRIKEQAFSETIENISRQFCEIYNEARIAEKRGLKNICGAGYRKALEFLIKDYLVKEKKEKKEEIEKNRLFNCIDQYIDDLRIKECAEIAAWLGEDETRYYKKYEEKDLDDLKVIIDLTINWIESESLSKKITEEEPEPKIKPKKKRREKAT